MKDSIEEKSFPVTDGNQFESSNWKQSKGNQLFTKRGSTQLSNGSLTCSFPTERRVSCSDLLVTLDTPDKEPVLVLTRTNCHEVASSPPCMTTQINQISFNFTLNSLKMALDGLDNRA